MKTIYLIRHGQASAGTSDYDRLSPLGQRQATLLGEYMKNNDLRQPEEIWSGSLVRQQRTAQLFCTSAGLAVDINTEQRLNEYDHRGVHNEYHPNKRDLIEQSVEGVDLSPHMSFNTYQNIIHNWMQCDGDTDQYQGESWHEFQRRTLLALHDIASASTARTLALFTSGGVISVIAGQLAQHPEQSIPDMIWNFNNGSVTTVQYQTERAQLQEINNVDHFKKHNDLTLLTKI